MASTSAVSLGVLFVDIKLGISSLPLRRVLRVIFNATKVLNRGIEDVPDAEVTLDECGSIAPNNV